MNEQLLKSDNLGVAGDDFYELLMNAHEGLTTEESNQLNARLILMMANQIGEFPVLRALLEKARDT